MGLVATIDPRSAAIDEWRTNRRKRHGRPDPRVAKLRRGKRQPRWWEGSYGPRVGDGDSWAKFLREMVERPGWSVARLARESHINRSTLFRWLAGKGGLTIASVRTIARALDVDMAVAMMAAGDTLGPPKTDDDPEMRRVVEHPRLTPEQKERIIAAIRTRRAQSMEQTQAMIDLVTGEGT